LGSALVAGNNRVPSPPTGKTALRKGLNVMIVSIEAPPLASPRRAGKSLVGMPACRIVSAALSSVDQGIVMASDRSFLGSLPGSFRHPPRVLLIFGERQIKPDTITTPANPALPTTLDFTVPENNAAGDPVTVAGDYVVRLRVDGVDSIPVVYAGTPPIPAFDTAQTVVVS